MCVKIGKNEWEKEYRTFYDIYSEYYELPKCRIHFLA